MLDNLQAMFYGGAIAFMIFCMYITMSIDLRLDKLNDTVRGINICVKEV